MQFGRVLFCFDLFFFLTKLLLSLCYKWRWAGGNIPANRSGNRRSIAYSNCYRLLYTWKLTHLQGCSFCRGMFSLPWQIGFLQLFSRILYRRATISLWVREEEKKTLKDESSLIYKTQIDHCVGAQANFQTHSWGLLLSSPLQKCHYTALSPTGQNCIQMLSMTQKHGP